MIASQRSQAASANDLRGWIALLYRRRAIVAGSILAALICVAFFLYWTPTRYRAEAVLALNVRNVQVSPVANVVSELPQEQAVIRTEIDLIGSRLMAERVLNRLDSAKTNAAEANREEFWPEQPSGGIVGGLWRQLAGLWRDDAEAAAAAPANRRREIIDTMLRNLKVSNDGRSYTIFVAYTAHDPEFAARVANTYAQAYLDQQVEFQTTGIQSASEWLRSKLQTMRVELEQSELAVEAFRQQAGLSEFDGATPMMMQVNALNSEIALARSARAAAEARLQTALDLAQNGAGIEGFTEILASPVIQSLRRDEAVANQSLLRIEPFEALKASEAGVLAAQRSGIETQINAEIQRVLKSLDSEVQVAKRKEQELQSALRDMEAASSASRRTAIHLNQLQREANANRALYESFLSRYKQTIEQDGLAAPEAHLISAATAPRRPDRSKLPIIGLALFAGMGGGVGLAMLRDRLDRRVLLVSPVEVATGVPVVATLPRPDRLHALESVDQPVRKPASPYAVAVRRIAAALLQLSEGQGARIVMIASAEPGTGKTEFAAALSRSFALTGRSVLMIDGDLYAPRAAASFGTTTDATLADVLSGSVKWTDAVLRDPLSPVSLIAAAPYDGDTGALLASPQFENLIQAVRPVYDLIIIDAPPVLHAPDAGFMGRRADLTVLVAQWGRTTLDHLALAVSHLGMGGVPVDGIVLNDVDPQWSLLSEAGGDMAEPPGPAERKGGWIARPWPRRDSAIGPFPAAAVYRGANEAGIQGQPT